MFRKSRFPNALPYIFAGLKLNASLSVIGAIVGEFVASEAGLGTLSMAGGVALDTPSIFAALTLIAFLGLGLYALVVLRRAARHAMGVPRHGGRVLSGPGLAAPKRF